MKKFLALISQSRGVGEKEVKQKLTPTEGMAEERRQLQKCLQASDKALGMALMGYVIDLPSRLEVGSLTGASTGCWGGRNWLGMGSIAATKWLVSMLCDISMLASDTSSQTLIMLLFSGSGACPPKVLSLPH